MNPIAVMDRAFFTSLQMTNGLHDGRPFVCFDCYWSESVSATNGSGNFYSERWLESTVEDGYGSDGGGAVVSGPLKPPGAGAWPPTEPGGGAC